MVDPIPAEYPRITPYLSIDGAADAIAFYCDVLGFEERVRMPGPDGKVGHAELGLGNSVLMLSDSFEDMGGPPSAASLGGTPATLHVYVDDADAVFDKAVAAGATGVKPVADQFYGDRSGQFVDPWGHRWNVATHVEDVSPEEMARRAAEVMGT